MVKITLDGNELTLTDEQVKEIVKQYKGEENGLVFKPKNGEKYWVIDNNGYIFDYCYNNDSYDYERLSIGNTYRTKEEAGHDLEVRKALTRIRMDAPVWDIDWEETNQAKYFVYYNNTYKCLCINYTYSHKYLAPAYYKTFEQSEQAIRDHEDDYKLVFGVK